MQTDFYLSATMTDLNRNTGSHSPDPDTTEIATFASDRPTMKTPPRSSLLDLPAELSTQIFEYIATAQSKQDIPPADRRKTSLPSLCHVSRQVRHEFVPIFRSTVTVQADVWDFDFSRVIAYHTQVFRDVQQITHNSGSRWDVVVLLTKSMPDCKRGLREWLGICARGGLEDRCNYTVLVDERKVREAVGWLRRMREMEVDVVKEAEIRRMLDRVWMMA